VILALGKSVKISFSSVASPVSADFASVRRLDLSKSKNASLVELSRSCNDFGEGAAAVVAGAVTLTYVVASFVPPGPLAVSV